MAVYSTQEGWDLAQADQTLEGSFSAGCIDADFASEYSFESSRRDLHNTLMRLWEKRTESKIK